MKKIVYVVVLLMSAMLVSAETPSNRAQRLTVSSVKNGEHQELEVVAKEAQSQVEEDDVESFINDTALETPIPEIRPVSWLEAKAKQIALAIILPMYAAKEWCAAQVVAFFLYLQSLKGGNR